jgi:hypothetical protein
MSFPCSSRQRAKEKAIRVVARRAWASVVKETAGSGHGFALGLGRDDEARTLFDLVARYLSHRKPGGDYALRISRETGSAEILLAFVQHADAEAFAAVVGAGPGSGAVSGVEGWASWRRLDFDDTRRQAVAALAPAPRRAAMRTRPEDSPDEDA